MDNIDRDSMIYITLNTSYRPILLEYLASATSASYASIASIINSNYNPIYKVLLKRLNARRAESGVSGVDACPGDGRNIGRLGVPGDEVDIRPLPYSM